MSDTHGLQTKWFQAAAEGDVQTLREVEDLSINFNKKDSRGLTALMIAAASGHESSTWFLAQWSDLDAVDNRGWTAATHAAFKGQEACLSALAESGADLDARDFLGTTAAMRAAIGGHAGCLRVLANYGADLLAVDHMGMAAATHAQRKGHSACISILAAEAHHQDHSRPLSRPVMGQRLQGSLGGSWSLREQEFRATPQVRRVHFAPMDLEATEGDVVACTSVPPGRVGGVRGCSAAARRHGAQHFGARPARFATQAELVA